MGMITDDMVDDRCQICGGVGPTAAVYLSSLDETVETCDDCNPENEA